MKELPSSNNNNNDNIMEDTIADDVITNEETVRFVNAEGAGTETLGASRWKQGFKFCSGCCCHCDVRYATIVVDIIKACIYVLLLLISLFAFYCGDYQGFYRDISHCIGVKDLFIFFPWFILTLVWCLICIPIFSCGIYGAIEYNTIFVGVALMLHSVECVMALMGSRFIAAIIAALCAYPHVFYIMEVSYYRGIPVPKMNTQ